MQACVEHLLVWLLSCLVQLVCNAAVLQPAAHQAVALSQPRQLQASQSCLGRLPSQPCQQGLYI